MPWTAFDCLITETRWVRSAAAELNRRDEMGVLRLVTNATGFNVTCPGKDWASDVPIASWDKVQFESFFF